MLTELTVEGLGVIERAELALESGAIALTGETGAGKTLVVAAVGLLLGERADRTLVRSGAPEARVEGRFVMAPGHPAAAWLARNELAEPSADGEVEVVVTRSVGADGRGRARVNGRMVTSASLGELGSMLVEIAGQHQHQRLGSPSWQRNLLDRFAGARAEELAERVAEAVRRAAAASAAIEALTDGERARTRELDVLRYEIGEIEEVGPLQGEGDRLRAEAARLDRAERTAAGVAGALESLQGEGGADELVARAARALEDVEDPAAAALRQRLRSVALELGDVAGSMAALMVAPDPESLESTRSRLAALAGLERKYGHDESEVLAYLERARARVADLEGAEVDLERHERALEEHRRVAAAAADELSKLRAEAAPRLERAVEKRLATLALEDARFRVVLEQRPLYEGGAEAVELRVAANPGEPIRPVARVASGGELSRISLALHLTTTTEPATTMIFDEVDAGVGGRAARAVGRALAELTRAHGGQAVVVTHLPQVAAEADVHLRVVKETRRGRTGATVERLEGEARVEELSRMLAGLPESERARGHAQELLTMAARAGPS